MKTYLTITLALLFITAACNKSDEITKDPPCITIPCGDTNERQQYNRVAYDLDYRIGRWINLWDAGNSKDTLIFHTDSTFTNVNKEGEGIRYGKYDFEHLYFNLYENFANEILEDPIKRQTYYNDTTGIFSMLKVQQYSSGDGVLYQNWGHYIKIDDQ